MCSCYYLACYLRSTKSVKLSSNCNMPDPICYTSANKEMASPNNSNDSESNALEVSKLEALRSAGPLPPPPNGGLMAWLQVAGAFVVFFNTWGLINTFAIFQTYCESGALFTESSSNISWIGSIQCFLLQPTGIIAGPVYDRGYLRLLLLSGSFSNRFWLYDALSVS